jgi:hypothetical protein
MRKVRSFIITQYVEKITYIILLGKIRFSRESVQKYVIWEHEPVGGLSNKIKDSHLNFI